MCLGEYCGYSAGFEHLALLELADGSADGDSDSRLLALCAPVARTFLHTGEFKPTPTDLGEASRGDLLTIGEISMEILNISAGNGSIWNSNGKKKVSSNTANVVEHEET